MMLTGLPLFAVAAALCVMSPRTFAMPIIVGAAFGLGFMFWGLSL